MARNDGSDIDPNGEILRRFREFIAGMNSSELRDVYAQVMSAATDTAMAAARQPAVVPTRRRPRREAQVTLRVRVDIAHATPPIWRRLELSSSLFLDDLHQILQLTFGWTDSHLHRFALGRSVWDRDAELFLCPYDVEDGEDDGVPTGEVRVDEVLAEPGDVLTYVYDYGDEWELRIRLEEVVDRLVDGPPAVCTGGRRAAPPEDVGGIGGYEADLEVGLLDGAEVFDPADVNRAIAAVDQVLPSSLPRVLATVMHRAAGDPVTAHLAGWVLEADLDDTVEVDPDVAATMVRRYVWLLDRVGADGIKLTQAGYLPPVHVEPVMAELGLSQWIGKRNREDLTYPVLEFRESAQRLGLVRKYRGRLSVTKLGDRLRGDPLAMWWHIAARLPGGGEDTAQHHAGAVTLLAVAAGQDVSSEVYRSTLTRALSAGGWRLGEGRPLTSMAVASLDRDLIDVFDHLGAFGESDRVHHPAVPTAGGRLLARAALQRQAGTSTQR